MSKKKKNRKFGLFTFLLIFASLFMCIGYASINSITLNLNGFGNVATPRKLFIADVQVKENNSTTSVNLYDETFLDTRVQLNNSGSTSTLSITIKNNSRYDYSFVQVDYMVGNTTYDNTNIVFDLVGLSQGDIIKSTESLTFDLVFSYDDSNNISDTILNSKLNFSFKNISGMELSQLVLSNEKEPTNGEDGLYSYQDIHYYSGTDVNNYIWYNCKNGYNSGEDNCEVWRVLEVKSDGTVRIIKDDVISQETILAIENETDFWYEHIGETNPYKADKMVSEGKGRFDPKGRRPTGDLATDVSYCQKTANGCNAFSSGTTNGSFSSLTVDSDSSIKIYLNDLYYEQALTEAAKEHLQVSEYDIGIIDINVGKTIDSIYSAETNIKCNSKVALLNTSDYVLASNDSSCRTNFLLDACGNDNWLKSDSRFMFLNGKVTSTNAQIWVNETSGKISSYDSNQDLYIRPVITLKSSVIATGTGSTDDYYVIVG